MPYHAAATMIETISNISSHPVVVAAAGSDNAQCDADDSDWEFIELHGCEGAARVNHEKKARDERKRGRLRVAKVLCINCSISTFTTCIWYIHMLHT